MGALLNLSAVIAILFLVVAADGATVDTPNATTYGYTISAESGGEGRDNRLLIGGDGELEFLMESETSRRMMLLGAESSRYKTERTLVGGPAGCGRPVANGRPYSCSPPPTGGNPEHCSSLYRGNPCTP